MPLSLSEQKKTLRADIREKKKSFSKEDLILLSRQCCARLEALPEFIQARTILLYYALPDEVGTQELIEHWQRKKTILLPVVHGESLWLKKFQGEGHLLTNQWNIPEPSSDIDIFTDYEQIDLAIIPGMAFDANGHRLGRGKGFYDRLLPNISCPTIGLCFPFQLVEKIPAEPWDIPVQRVL